MLIELVFSFDWWMVGNPESSNFLQLGKTLGMQISSEPLSAAALFPSPKSA